MKHVIGVIVFIVVLASAAWGALNVNLLLPAQASQQAQPIDSLFNLQFKLVAVLFGLIAGILLYSVIFFRRKKGDETDGPHITGNTPLEITWTTIPFLLVIGLSLIGSQALAETLRVDPRAIEVKVTGQQWSWRFEYPAYGITSDVLYMPLNKQVLFKITSIDVIHSFWVPEFRVKQDAVPGRVDELRVTASKIGEYSLVCAEICGTKHANMASVVKVISQEDFTAWVAGELGATVANPADRGAKWLKQYGCLACHSVDGSKMVGPSFQGLYARQEEMESGATVSADDAYLIESIRQPAKQVVKGFPNAMPPAAGEALTDVQIQDIIEYIKTLK